MHHASETTSRHPHRGSAEPEKKEKGEGAGMAPETLESLAAREVYLLDGRSLTPEALYALGRNDRGRPRLDLSPEAWKAVADSRKEIEQFVASGRVGYGINTGFGSNVDKSIPAEDVDALQVNLILSHSCGVGSRLAPERARMLLVARLNTVALGHSGVRPENVRALLAGYNSGCVPEILEQGSVGASGDLAPLAHLIAGFMGYGLMWDPEAAGYFAAREVMARHRLPEVRLGAKEGLALINGTQFITSLLAEAVVRAGAVARQSDVVAALTVEALGGTARGFDARIHDLRPQPGQREVAATMRALLSPEPDGPSELYARYGAHRIQEAYSLRCIPQLHGVLHSTLRSARETAMTELASVTDNPILCDGDVLSGGNFHGEYPARACDALAISVAKHVGTMERRIERMINSKLSNGLPAYLVGPGAKPGLNSGFMIVQYAAAALASECKMLAHPASVDTVPTSEGTEDVVSMGAHGAVRLLRVVQNAEEVLGLELLTACQALELRGRLHVWDREGEPPLRTTRPLDAVFDMVRETVPLVTGDVFMRPLIAFAGDMIRSCRVWQAVEAALSHSEQ